jgi:hypothetical protein
METAYLVILVLTFLGIAVLSVVALSKLSARSR